MNRDGDIGILIRNFINFAESRSCQILTIILLRNLMSEKGKKSSNFGADVDRDPDPRF